MKRVDRVGPLVKNRPFTIEGINPGILHLGQIPGSSDLYAWVVDRLESELANTKTNVYLLVLTGDEFESHWSPIRSYIDTDGFEWHVLRYVPEVDSHSIY